MLIEHLCYLDKKGRLTLPEGMRPPSYSGPVHIIDEMLKLGITDRDVYFLALPKQKHLHLLDEWRFYEAARRVKNYHGPDMYRVRETFFGHSFDNPCDDQGRVLIPEYPRRRLEREVLIIEGPGPKKLGEIWNPADFEQFMRKGGHDPRILEPYEPYAQEVYERDMFSTLYLKGFVNASEPRRLETAGSNNNH